MSDNTTAVLIGVLILIFFGSFVFGVHGCARIDSADKQHAERLRAVSRDRCIAANGAWVEDNCIPRCVPTEAPR